MSSASRERRRAANNKWARKHGKEAQRRWAVENPGKHRDYKRKSLYGLSVEDVDKLLRRQRHKCAICRQPETRIDYRTGKVMRLSVDHCHKTGKVRGLLCFECNTLLAKARDSVKILTRAIVYLEKNS